MRIVLRVWAVVVLAFIYVPLLTVVVNSFNTDRSFAWPPPGLTLHWWGEAWQNAGARDALWTSVKAGLGATAIALVLGTLAAFALSRHRFFGRRALSLVIVLPIALPGIVTGLALNSAIQSTLQPLGVGYGLFTIIIGHATFCVVTVYNNVSARLNRMPGAAEEASMDLGAGVFRTFRRVTFPELRSALLAGGLLSFALSFDEIVVTTFTAGPNTETLPIWIFGNLARPNQAPIVNVVAVVVILISLIPIYLAQRLSTGAGARSMY
ncbi:MAG TPA: ABC transporter permease [Streptosporangiaceae bacterium]